MGRREFKVFISHSSKDKSLTKRIVEGVEKEFRVWFDEEEMRTGADLLRSIDEAITNCCQVALFFLSENALNSEWIAKELEVALKHEAGLGYPFVIPILMELDPSRVASSPLRNRVALKLYDQTEDQLELLISQICRALNQKEKEILQLMVDGGPDPRNGANPPSQPPPVSQERKNRERALTLARQQLFGPMADFETYELNKSEKAEYLLFLDKRFRDRIEAYLRARMGEDYNISDAQEIEEELIKWVHASN